MKVGRKTLTLTFIVLLLTSLLALTFTSTYVQAVSKPSVPQFSIKLVDNSYDISPSATTTVDPYTGTKSTSTIPGYHIERIEIEITIKNQLFTPYTGNGHAYNNLYYYVQVKGHFTEDWQVWCVDFKQSDSQYTVITRSAQMYAVGSKLDFRVQVAAGYEEGRILAPSWIHFDPNVTSDWSKVQTFTIPSKASSVSQPQTIPSQNPAAPFDNNQSQASDQIQPPSFMFQQSFLLWIGTFLFIGVVVAVVMVLLKRYLKTSYNNDSLLTQ
jgi:hypothetical protein